MEQRLEFVRLARQEGANRRELCRRFGIHPATCYKWLSRGTSAEELTDRSRRPHESPLRTAAALEQRIVAVRDAHPAWGARKIARCLEREGVVSPAVSTVHEVLRRHGRIIAPPGGAAAHQRFEKAAPNLLWQMDFKGHIALTNGLRCHPLTILDDHSRYAIGLQACADEQASTVQDRLEPAFRRYGLPDAVFVDNGTPWGDSSGQRWTRFGVWLLKLGVAVLHSRPYHPQSRGKNERFHRTLKAEVFACRRFRDLAEVQRAILARYLRSRWDHAVGANFNALVTVIPGSAASRACFRKGAPADTAMRAAACEAYLENARVSTLAFPNRDYSPTRCSAWLNFVRVTANVSV
jgi:transposase InsO family protein